MSSVHILWHRHLYIKDVVDTLLLSLCKWHVWCLCPVTSPAGCRCHWLSVFRCRGHWVPGILSDPAPECCWAEEPRMRRAAQGQREGVLSQPVRARPDRKRAAKYNFKCWHDSNSGKLRGAQWETRHRGHSYISVTWVRRERGDQYGHWWWWTVIHGQSGGVEIVPVIPAKIVNKWTHKHGALWGVWVSLPQIRLRLGHWSGVLVEMERLSSDGGTEKFCKEWIKQSLRPGQLDTTQKFSQWTPFFLLALRYKYKHRLGAHAIQKTLHKQNTGKR